MESRTSGVTATSAAGANPRANFIGNIVSRGVAESVKNEKMNKEKILEYFKREYRKLKHKYIIIPGLFILACGLIYNEYYIYKVDNCDYDIISCKVYEVVRVIKNPGFGISYKYKINGIEYDEYDTEPNIYKNEFRYFLIGRNVPLLVCKSNHKYQEILLMPEDFKERNLPYPDSLKIYLEYLK